MDAVRDDFRLRVRELLVYLRHVGVVSKDARSESEVAVARSLRAAAYLITYNMVEATARNAVRAVFDRLEAESVSFDTLTYELKCFLLSQARRKASEKLANDLSTIAFDMVTKVFDPETLFSGNVDVRALQKAAKQIGYKPKHPAGPEKAALLTVKANRNDLAHGNKTFSEIGRDATVGDVRTHAAYAIRHMRELMRSVAEFLEKREYLTTNSV